MTGKLPDVTDANFQSEVLESETPVLVDFWAPWCGPCRVVHPILEEIQSERASELRIVSLNVDDNQQTAARYEVLSIPTLILFRDGAETKRIVGALPKRRLEAELEPALAAADCVVIVTDHSVYDWATLARLPVAVVDTRHVVSKIIDGAADDQFHASD